MRDKEAIFLYTLKHISKEGTSVMKSPSNNSILQESLLSMNAKKPSFPIYAEECGARLRQSFEFFHAPYCQEWD